jgi:hypothetical protein
MSTNEANFTAVMQTMEELPTTSSQQLQELYELGVVLRLPVGFCEPMGGVRAGPYDMRLVDSLRNHGFDDEFPLLCVPDVEHDVYMVRLWNDDREQFEKIVRDADWQMQWKTWLIIDGAHRLAICKSLDIDIVHAKVCLLAKDLNSTSHRKQLPHAHAGSPSALSSHRSQRLDQ